MLELAHAWWLTTDALLNAPFQIKELKSRIASENAQAQGHSKYAHLHLLKVMRLEQELEAVQKLLPQLEKQKRDLEQRYRDAGYDDVPYSSWTTGEMRAGGKGIEQVGWAIGLGPKPASLQPTGIEFDIASFVLAAPAILRLGKAALGKAAAAAERKLAGEAAALRPFGGGGGGHHIPAKRAFEGAAGYDAKAALAIPRNELARLNVKHSSITGAQKTLYREFAKTGEKLSWEVVERIETEALVRAGLDARVAQATVRTAIEALKRDGVPGPITIPWGS